MAVAAFALLVGITIGGLAIDRPGPANTPITIDSFPKEVLGLARDYVEMRDGGSEAVNQRLNDYFQAQLDGYRFAYGGEGAEFNYGESLTLTIVNGQLALDVPISDDTVWGTPGVISLNTKDTKCVSVKGSNISQSEVVINPETGTLVTVWTDCVLFDVQRGLALRLTGLGRVS